MQQDIVAPKITSTSDIPHVNTPVAVAAQGGNEPALQPVQDVKPALKAQTHVANKQAADVKAQQPARVQGNQDTDKNTKNLSQKQAAIKKKKQGKPLGVILFAVLIASALIAVAVYIQLQQTAQ